MSKEHAPQSASGEFQDPLENYDAPEFDDPLEQALAENLVTAIQHTPFTRPTRPQLRCP
jgi:hypothetical protein